MSKIWAGRLGESLDERADGFNSSIGFDYKLCKYDIEGSIAHAGMLAAKGIITMEDAKAIIEGLGGILEDLEEGRLEVDMGCEDIHTFVEQALTARIGDAGKKLHTARSRNDQVALDLRMYLRDEVLAIIKLTEDLLDAIATKAETYKGAIMPGYTHLQRAQPITFGHHLMAYAMMLIRDIGRMKDAYTRMNVSPIGCCALAGTTYDIDRDMEARQLGFEGIALNSIDGVSDRDFCIELQGAFAIMMMHLSRFSEEIILWSSLEFGFVELDAGFSTGSSIMPQKKNPDMAELVRGKTGRVYGNLFASLTMMKGLPLAYNKDMQEDKEAIFDSVETVKKSLAVYAPMVATMHVNEDSMMQAARAGFMNATDLADYLVRKGLPFRSAYKAAGQIVAKCLHEGKVLEELTIEEYKQYNELFDVDLYESIDLEACVERRISKGGTSRQSVEMQIEYVRAFLYSCV